jgi:hypothetical protein
VSTRVFGTILELVAMDENGKKALFVTPLSECDVNATFINYNFCIEKSRWAESGAPPNVLQDCAKIARQRMCASRQYPS